MSPLSAKALLVRLPAPAAGGPALTSSTGRLSVLGAQFELEPLFTVRAADRGMGLTAAPPAFEWHIARTAGAPDSAHAWELAHALNGSAGLAMAGRAPLLVEPDFLQEWPYEAPAPGTEPGLAAAADVCEFEDQFAKLPHVDGRFAWHLDDDFSQLKSARTAAGNPASTVRIVHLDTGFDPEHHVRPARLRGDLQRNFVDGQPIDDAHDPGNRGFLKNPGHGTGTLSILAGSQFGFQQDGYSFDDVLGGAPDAEIVPVRVGNSVVQLLTSDVAKGINYAVELCSDEATRVHVISMSMGGVASHAWADAVNMAYDAGILYVAAAGNNFAAGTFGLPTHLIVYPARFRRVVAACGVMANSKPYYGLPFKTMQGNWGPDSKMATAMSAYTPNMPWAKLGCAEIVKMDGAGTSSATPQIAAAAALYFQRHAATLLDPANYPEPWMRVEAVRQALFTQADKTADAGSPQKLGNGLLRATRSLAFAPPPRASLHRAEPDTAVFPLLQVLTGLGAAPSPAADSMLALEATQLAHRWSRTDRPNPLDGAVPDPDLPLAAIPSAQVRRFLEAVLEHPDASKQLKARVVEARAAIFGAVSTPPPPTVPGKKPSVPDEAAAPGVATAPATRPSTSPGRPFSPSKPVSRRLRGYSVDPSLTTQSELASVSQVTFSLPWEPLAPGPVGEYLEVIDVDPGSGCFYEPVNLDDPMILAQDGLAPSEGTPQFHQQMTYAVASVTIRNFEHALGRRSLWRPGHPPRGANPKDDSVYVQRLRVYPHALREQNAFYSPAKVALLFGYFNSDDDDPGDHVPGALVFACLSHDIIAHETTHALLDGMHRRFLNPSNPDVRAFHEGFADIVALLQHFTVPGLLRQQISTTRGAIRSENILGQLAGEFGRASGRRGALRDAIGSTNPQTGEWTPHKPDPSEYLNTVEAHDRGAILVAAVFDAFLGVYERRTSDLLRLATGGSGVLEPGAIHPDLVDRLCGEAGKAAGHVLTMCIRALDYCPPTDITFGEFLRAIMTADTDAVPDDDLGYRVAFIEAFRRRGIYPRDLKTLSPDSLLWRNPATDELQPSQALESGLERIREYAERFFFVRSHDGEPEPREEVFHLQRAVRRELHEWLEHHFQHHPDGKADASYLGLDPRHSFEVHSARSALRPSPDGDIDAVFLLGMLQDRLIPSQPDQPNSPPVSFEGGSTLVVDLRRLKIRYCIRKNIGSATRMVRQQAFTSAQLEGLRATYFGAAANLEVAEPFALLHRGV